MLELCSRVGRETQRGGKAADGLAAWASDASLKVLNGPLCQPGPLGECRLREARSEPGLAEQRGKSRNPDRARHRPPPREGATYETEYSGVSPAYHRSDRSARTHGTDHGLVVPWLTPWFFVVGRIATP